jgi:outer membrane receptor for ferrienterochelin and colicins
MHRKPVVQLPVNWRWSVALMGVVAITIGLNSRIQADDKTAPAGSPEPYVLEEVVVTAQYGPQDPDRSIYRVDVLDRDWIELRAARDLGELLADQLDFNIARHSVFGSSPTVQGISHQNVKILLDGVPVIGRLNGIIDLDQINLSNIERVEVIEGPTSVYYGTDALAGTVNLISRKSQRQPLELDVTGYLESVGVQDMDLRAGYTDWQNLFQISVGRKHFEGYSPQDVSREQAWKPREQYHGDWRYSRELAGLSGSFSGSYFNEDLQDLAPLEEQVATDSEYTTRRFNHDLALNGWIREHRYLDLLVSYSDYRREKRAFQVDFSGGQAVSTELQADRDLTRFHSWMARGSYSTSVPGAAWNYQVGYDITFSQSAGERISDAERSIHNLAGFASLRLDPIPRLTLQPALRFARNSVYDAPLTPALNARYDFSPQVCLRASYARGFRAPSLKELYLDLYVPAGPFVYHIAGNEDLHSERSHNLNLSLDYDRPVADGATLSLGSSLFYNKVDELITLSVMEENSRHYINLDRFTSYGANLQLEYQHPRGLDIDVGISETARYNLLSKAYPISSFSYTPDANCRVTWRLRGAGLKTSLAYRYNGRVPGYYEFTDRKSREQEIRETVVEDYHLLDLTLVKTMNDGAVDVEVGAKNLLGVKNIETTDRSAGAAHSSNLAGWGRTLFTRLEIHLQ